MGCRDGGSDFVEEKCGAGQYSGTEPCRPPKRVIMVHGTGLARDGSLGMNKYILDEVVGAWQSGVYERIVLPANICEDTGEGKPLMATLYREYLLKCGIPTDAILFSPDAKYGVASDTSTEVVIASRMLVANSCRFVSVDAFAFFPHSLKVRRVWNAVTYRNAFHTVRLVNVHHIIKRLPSWFDTIKWWAAGFLTAAVGTYDPLGQRFPAKEIKRRRRDLYTPNHLKDKVIF
ncbi:MAG: hypothetical protein Q7R73_02370 [bacterium]|nr:hypothetical protein [bacterium]